MTLLARLLLSAVQRLVLRSMLPCCCCCCWEPAAAVDRYMIPHNKLGDRSFPAAGTRLWTGLRRPGLTFDSFRQSLKTQISLSICLSVCLSVCLSIYLSSPPGTQQQTHRAPRLRRMMGSRRTNRRTDGHRIVA